MTHDLSGDVPAEILRYSRAYEARIAQDMRDSPHVAVGMLVTVYSYFDHDVPIGIGHLKRMKWSGYYQQYLCDVMLGDGLMCGITAGRLKRRVLANILPFVDVIEGGFHG